MRAKCPYRRVGLAVAMLCVWLLRGGESVHAQSATTKAPANLVSNPSFEAVHGNEPADWSFYSRPEYLHATDGVAHEGKRSVLADVPQGTPLPHTAADQWVAITTPGLTYELSAWVKIVEARDGAVRLYLDWYDKGRNRISLRFVEESQVTNGWKQLAITMKAPPNAAWARVMFPYLTGGIKVYTDSVHLVATSEATAPVPTVVIGGLEARGNTPTTVRIGWTSNIRQHDVLFRKVAKRAKWQTDEDVRDDTHTIIDLDPDSVYIVKVRARPNQIIDASGKTVEQGQPVETPELRIRTRPLEARVVRKLGRWPLLGQAEADNWTATPSAPDISLWPTQHLDTFLGDTTYPCIKEYNGSFYVVECHSGGIYLSQVSPATLKPIWDKPKELVAPVKEVTTYQGIPATAIFRDKLWVMWNRQTTGDPKYQITDSRQMLLSYDFATEKVSEPIEFDAERPGAGTWEGGIAEWQGQLWFMWMEAWLENGKRRTQIVVVPYLPDTGRGKPVVWDDCPTAYPYGPSLNVFENQLLIVYSDLAVTEGDPGREPLWCVRFNGHDFHDPQLIQGLGRNRYGRGVQVGDSFYLVYKSNTEWMMYGYEYQDIALTRIGPKGDMIETVWYVDDQKYNSSPDIIAHGNALYVVYGKFAHAYDNPQYPARCLGTYWGKIDVP